MRGAILVAMLVLLPLAGCLSEDPPAAATKDEDDKDPAAPTTGAVAPTTSAAAPGADDNASTPPPPERLPLVTMPFRLAEAAATQTVDIPEGVVSMSVSMWLNVTDDGPYLVLSGVASDTATFMWGPSDDFTTAPIQSTWDLGIDSGSAGDAADEAEHHELATPDAGEWTLENVGHGDNVQADVVITLHYA